MHLKNELALAKKELQYIKKTAEYAECNLSVTREYLKETNLDTGEVIVHCYTGKHRELNIANMRQPFEIVNHRFWAASSYVESLSQELIELKTTIRTLILIAQAQHTADTELDELASLIE
jgi:hypothetical protein